MGRSGDAARPCKGASVTVRSSYGVGVGAYRNRWRAGVSVILTASALMGAQLALMATPAAAMPAAATPAGTPTTALSLANSSLANSPSAPVPGTVPTPPVVQEAQANTPPSTSPPLPSLDATQVVPPPDLGPPKQGPELVDRRTANTKTFATDRPGTFVTESSAAPVHYRDAKGHWQEINTTLRLAKDGRLHNNATGFDLSVASNATDASVARLDLDASHSVGFGLEGAAKVNGKASKDATTYSAAWRDTSLNLISRRNGLKEDLVLASPAAPDRFVFPLKLKGLAASIDAKGDVVYRDESGAERARTPHGFMADAKVDPRSGEPATSLGVHFALIPSKGRTALEVTLDRAWLNDPARAYPVTVDPEFITATAADDTYVMSGFSRDNSSDTELKVGTYDGGAHIGRAYLHFDTSAIQGKVIQWGRLDIAESWSWNCDAGGPTPYRVIEGWDGRTMTDWPGAAIDVPAGGVMVPSGGDCPNRTFSADMNGASANWASGVWNNLGIALVAADETDNNYWKKFASLETGAPPALHVGWTEPATPPSAPQNVVATARNQSATVSWSPPANNGGAAVDTYVVYAMSYPSGAYANSYAFACGSCGSATPTGLANGQQYYFLISAHNPVNWGPWGISNVVAPTPQPPGPPQSPAATPRNRSAIVSWAAPADNGGTAIDFYGVFAYSYPSYTYLSYTQGCATCTSVSVPNLTNGQQYAFGIYAHNAVNWGAGVGTNAVVPTITTPNAPATVIAAPGSASATVAWSAPTDNGGAAIDASYVLAYTSPSLAYANKYVQVCATCTSGTLTGLTNGTAYQFLVLAHNSVGNGAYTWSNVVTPGASPDLLSPTSVVAVRGDTQAQLTWVAPITHTLVPVSYTVTTYRAGGSQAGTPLQVAATPDATVAVTVTGLTNGIAVNFRVTATTLFFITSPPAQSNTITPAGKPIAPAAVNATAGDHQASVNWTAANDNGSPVTRYTVTASPDGATTATPSGFTTQATVSGLTNGVNYTFTVVATNAIGDSPQSSASNTITPQGLPLTPTSVRATAGDGQAVVSWTPPDPNGSMIVQYTVISGAPSVQVMGGTTHATVAGLINGTQYTFQVVATNSVGDSQPSAPSNSVTPGPPPPPPSSAPGSPAIGLATGGNGQATVAWTAPSALNGATLTGYIVSATSSADGSTQTITLTDPNATTGTIGGLFNGTQYTLTVAATSDHGTSAPSPRSNSVWPLVSATAGARVDFQFGFPPDGDPHSIPCLRTANGTNVAYTCRRINVASLTVDGPSVKKVTYVEPGAVGGGNYLLYANAQLYEGCSYADSADQWHCTNSYVTPYFRSGTTNTNQYSGLAAANWVLNQAKIATCIDGTYKAIFYTRDASDIINNCT